MGSWDVTGRRGLSDRAFTRAAEDSLRFLWLVEDPSGHVRKMKASSVPELTRMADRLGDAGVIRRPKAT